MKFPRAMQEIRSSNEVPPDVAAGSNSIRDRILVGLVLLTLVRTGEALAGEQAAITHAELDRGVGKFRALAPTTPTMANPGLFTAPNIVDRPPFSSTEFRPRKHTLFDRDPAVNAFDDAPMLRGTNVWQRMGESKSHNGVRLLTLWESTGSTVSIQAGKHGDPSLQWTSRAMNRGGSTQGLLDQLFSVSLSRARIGLRGAAREGNTAMEAKAAVVPVVAGLK